MPSTPKDYSVSKYIKYQYQDAVKWEKTIRDSPLFNETGREAAIKDLWTSFWRKVHKLMQSHHGKILQSAGDRVQEGVSADVMPMEECVPIPEYATISAAPASSYLKSGMAPGILNASPAMHSSVSDAAAAFEITIPTTSFAKRMNVQQSEMPQQTFQLPVNPQGSGRFDFSGEGTRAACPPSEVSTADVQNALSNLTLSSGVAQAVQHPIRTPSGSLNLVARRNKWRESGRAMKHRRTRSTGAFPCLEGCVDKFFTRDRDRTRHYRDVHRKCIQYVCVDCDARLSRKDTLKRHRRICKKAKGVTV